MWKKQVQATHVLIVAGAGTVRFPFVDGNENYCKVIDSMFLLLMACKTKLLGCQNWIFSEAKRSRRY